MSGSHCSRGTITLIMGVLLILLAGVVSTAQGDTDLLSVSSAGVQGDNLSYYRPSVSADGRYVAFVSFATTLVANDTNSAADIFVRDRVTGTTERVSVSSAGAQSNGHSYYPSISSDGRYVAFMSQAMNLVVADNNYKNDVFVHDRVTETTELVSVNSSEQKGNDNSDRPSISSDGRYVAFQSEATNLVANDTNNFCDIFVRDRTMGTTERVSVSSAEAQGNNVSGCPSISANGRYVAFDSEASNLIGSDTGDHQDVFVRDRQEGLTERVSVRTGGLQGTGDSSEPCISADGSCVAFHSYASSLVSDDTNGYGDIFVRDRVAGTTERVSVNSSSEQSNNPSFASLSISGDGRYTAFYSQATNLVIDDTNARYDVFVRDRVAEATERVSVSSTGAQGDANSEYPCISANGGYVAFASYATNLVDDDTNGNADIFGAYRAVAFTIPDAKLSEDDTLVELTDVIVTAAFDDYFYVENVDRASGIRVELEDHELSVDDEVTIEGFVSTNTDFERFVEAGVVATTGTGSIAHLGMNNRWVGGGDFYYNPSTGAGQKGFITDEYGSHGWNNIGLLIRTWGKVTSVGADYFYVEDGSNLYDATNANRVKVYAPGLDLPSVDAHVVVTGISSCENVEGNLYRLLRIREQSDIWVANGQSATLTIYPAVNWFALPAAPFNPDPAAIIDDPDDLVNGLYRIDPITGDEIGYDSFAPELFQGMILGEGYLLANSDPNSYTYTYQGFPDALRDGDGVLTDICVSLPGYYETEGGGHCIGYPFKHTIPWTSIKVTDGLETLPILDAVSEGWLASGWWYWENNSISTIDPGQNPNMLPEHLYVVITSKSNIALIIQPDRIAPNPGTATSPATETGPSIRVDYSGASDTGGSGLKKVELWYKKGAGGTWTYTGLIQTGGSGYFTFTGMTGDGTYYFDLVAEDNAGNRSAGATADGDCNTVYEDMAPPTVVSTDPADEEKLVSADTQVLATFSEALNASTVNGATFTLKDSGDNAVAGTVSYDSENLTAVFTPDDPLVVNETFTATITTGVQDLEGNALASDYVWTFTTDYIIYVDLDATGTPDGESWETAFLTITDGLGIANSGCEVWVAEGTYSECITLPAGVRLYGGFEGNETLESQRDWVNPHVTTLDGNDAGSVVTVPAAAAPNDTVISDFTIQNGTATYGGGIHCDGSPTILRNKIAENIAIEYGGGIFCEPGTAPVIRTNVIYHNKVYDNTLSEIENPNDPTTGGGIYCQGDSHPQIINNTIAEQLADGGIYCESPATEIKNNIVQWNSGGGIHWLVSAGTPMIYYNYLSWNAPLSGINANYPDGHDQNGLNGNIGGGDPAFVDKDGHDYRINNWSPCVDKGNNDYVPVDDRDIDGNYRFADDPPTCFFGPKVDIGADENDQLKPPDLEPNPGIYYPLACMNNINMTEKNPASPLQTKILYISCNGKTAPVGELSTEYDGKPIKIDGTTTFKAKTQRDGWRDSLCVIGTYEFVTQPPTITPGAGTYITAPTTARLTCNNRAYGLRIFYTFENHDPTIYEPTYVTLNGEITYADISVTAPCTLRAMAVNYYDYSPPTEWTLSEVTAATYTVVGGKYVKPGGDGLLDGSSWSNAYASIGVALANSIPGNQVWVAAGTYAENITLPDGVALYGGFAGDEIMLSQRDWVKNVTIIQGSLNGSVVTIPAGINTNTILDGFTIRYGGGFGMGILGGGIRCAHNQATISDNIITNNVASNGGGIYCDASDGLCMPKIINNLIHANYTVLGSGGGIYCSSVYGFPCSPKILNNTIANNYSESQFGAGICCNGSAGAPIIGSNIVASNSSGIYQQSGIVPVLHHNNVYGNGTSNYEGLAPGEGDISLDSLFVDATSGDYHLMKDSPCIDTGWYETPILPATDLDGKPRLWRTTRSANPGIVDNQLIVDIGCYERPRLYEATVTVNACADKGSIQLLSGNGLASSCGSAFMTRAVDENGNKIRILPFVDDYVMDKVSDMGIDLLRFGCSDRYSWRDAVGPLASRTGNRPFFGTDEFIEFCEKINCPGKMFIVNYLTGSPQEAANWVEYCNTAVPPNPDPSWTTTSYGGADDAPGGYFAWLRGQFGHADPYGVEYWEIGNETYASVLGAQYGDDVADYIVAMKAKDPTIKVGAVLLNRSRESYANNWDAWDRSVLDSIHTALQGRPETVDFGILHYYSTLWRLAPLELYGQSPTTRTWRCPASGTYTFRVVARSQHTFLDPRYPETVASPILNISISTTTTPVEVKFQTNWAVDNVVRVYTCEATLTEGTDYTLSLQMSNTNNANYAGVGTRGGLCIYKVTTSVGSMPESNVWFPEDAEQVSWFGDRDVTQYRMDDIRAILTESKYGGMFDDTKIMISEGGLDYRDRNWANYGYPDYEPMDALRFKCSFWLSSYINTLINEGKDTPGKSNDITKFCHHCLADWACYGDVRVTGDWTGDDNPEAATPSYYLLKLYSELGGTTLVDSTAISPQFNYPQRDRITNGVVVPPIDSNDKTNFLDVWHYTNTDGDPIVKLEDPQYLDTVASRTDTNVYLMVTNRRPEAARTSITINGFNVDTQTDAEVKTLMVWTLQKHPASLIDNVEPELEANNETEMVDSPIRYVPDDVSFPEVGSPLDASNNFEYTFPAFSITLIKLTGTPQ